MPKRSSLWTNETKDLVKGLNAELRLNSNNWHSLKSNKNRRAAELITSALSQIINDGKESDIEELIEQALKWIRGESKDPGCPGH